MKFWPNQIAIWDYVLAQLDYLISMFKAFVGPILVGRK